MQIEWKLMQIGQVGQPQLQSGNPRKKEGRTYPDRHGQVLQRGIGP